MWLIKVLHWVRKDAILGIHTGGPQDVPVQPSDLGGRLSHIRAGACSFHAMEKGTTGSTFT